MHEALPREQLSEACWPGTQEPILTNAQWQAQTRPVSVAGKPHMAGKCRATKESKRPVAISGGETAHGRRRPYKHTSAQRQWQVKPHTVGIQQGCREGCPDGWRGALHRVHEALPREQLSEARRRGNRTRSAHKGRYIGTREPIPSSHKGRVTRSAHKRARDGRDVLTDGMGLCIECTRHCQGDGFSKLADQAHQSRYCRHARAESHGRHTGRREWEGSS